MKSIDEFYQYNDLMSVEITRFKNPGSKEQLKAIINKLVKNKDEDIEIELTIKTEYKICLRSIDRRISFIWLGMEQDEWWWKEGDTVDDIMQLIDTVMLEIDND